MAQTRSDASEVSLIDRAGHWLDSRSTNAQWILIAAVMVISALYAAHGLKRGWVPADEGFLGQTAERVLHGELPHRDYSEGYTGGLTFLNAAAFRLFGTNLASPRYMLFLFFLLWIPAFYYVASHFVSDPTAAALTLLAVAWSIPNYPAALPSWYNLFFATFGLAILLRYVATRHKGWLFAAGLCGGISFLFKISGLYFVAGVLLFLLFRERLTPGTRPASAAETACYRILLVISVLLYQGLVFGLLHKAANIATYIYFWTPDLAIGAAILWLEFHPAEIRSHRFSFMLGELTPFAAGVALPVAIFVRHYILDGSQSCLREIFMAGARQLQFAQNTPSPLKLFGGIFLNLVFIATVFLTRGKAAKVAGALCLVGIPVALLLIRAERYVDRAAWGMVWTVLPVAVIFGAALLLRPSAASRVSDLQRQKIFLVLSVTAACSLVQFPFTISIYFCYVAPLAFLSVAAVCGLQKPPRWAAAGALGFCLLYVVLEVTPGFIDDMGEHYVPESQTARLSIPRAGGLRVYPASARLYEELNALVTQHARGEYIYASPDCPEVYFLNGFRNPTRTLFDYQEDPEGRTQRILAAIRQHDVNLVVLNTFPQFSGPVPADLRSALELEFPNRAQTGRFQILWKEPGGRRPVEALGATP